MTGSLANGLGSGGGFCAGSSHVVSHQASTNSMIPRHSLTIVQRINSSASVFSASLPAMLATTASASIQMLLNQPTLLSNLQANIVAFRRELSKIEPIPLPNSTASEDTQSLGQQPNRDAIIHVPSHPASALIHIFLLNPPDTMEAEEFLLQEVVDELINLNGNGILITRARRLRGQETFEPEPSLKVCLSSTFSRKEMEKAGQSLRHALVKFCGSKLRLK